MDNFGAYEYGSQAADPGLGFGVIAFIAAVYLFYSFCVFKIAQKTGNSETAWFAFVPILNVVQMVQMARKPMWWLAVLFLVPVINFFMLFPLWGAISENAGNSPVLGYLTPLFGFVTVPIMAFTGGSGPSTPSPTQQPKIKKPQQEPVVFQ